MNSLFHKSIFESYSNIIILHIEDLYAFPVLIFKPVNFREKKNKFKGKYISNTFVELVFYRNIISSTYRYVVRAGPYLGLKDRMYNLPTFRAHISVPYSSSGRYSNVKKLYILNIRRHGPTRLYFFKWFNRQ